MAKTTSSGKPEVDRRTFLYAAGATAIVAAGWEAGRRADAAATASAPADATAVAHHHHATVDHRAFRYPEGDPAYGQLAGRRPQSLHKSASQMSRQEIRRFSRAYRWAVAKGYFDVFNDEHFNAQRNRHHGADVLAVAPPGSVPRRDAGMGIPAAALAPVVHHRGRGHAQGRPGRAQPP